ncbi:hypothetical protein [Prosthecobacter fluviatilis]|uniref:Uncharacterized protein n=1 Tax=Prosthecobacter fluviatilis TaxID=445931 RepID=A0ABW0KSR2_9BACT
MSSQKTEPISTWVEVDEDHDSGGMILSGDRSGLMALRDAIDIAITEGKAPIAAECVEFSGVRRVDALRKPEPQSFQSKLAGAGCLILIAIGFLIFLLGIWQLKSLILRFGRGPAEVTATSGSLTLAKQT